MQGQNQIIEARRNGMRPAAVFVEAGLPARENTGRWFRYEADMACGNFPTVHIPAEEMNRRPDLRFLAGCRVHLRGQAMDEQLLQMAEWIAEAGANHILATSENDNEIVQFLDGQWEAWQ